jgi:opine dehydrogenase
LTNSETPPQLFYRGPQLKTGAAFADAVDAERLDLGRALGLDLPTALQLTLAFYRDQGMAGDSLGEALGSFPGFAATPAPASFDHRYVDDDVVYGLACWEALGRLLGVPTPAITAVVETLSIASGRDLRVAADPLAESFLDTLPVG